MKKCSLVFTSNRYHILGMLLLLSILPLCLYAQETHNPVPYRKGQLWGYADPVSGKILHEPVFDSADLFSEYSDRKIPLAWVKKGERYGLVNRLGQLVLPVNEPYSLEIQFIAPGYFSVTHFAKGATSEEEEAGLLGEMDYALRPIAFIDSLGRNVGKPFKYQIAVDRNSEGGRGEDSNGFDSDADMADYFVNTYQVIWEDNKSGIFDLKKAKLIIEPVWGRIYIEGKIAFASLENEHPLYGEKNAHLINLLTGYVSKISDSIKIKPAYRPSDDMVLVINKQSSLLGFLDINGSPVIPCQYKVANQFSKNGLTKVQNTHDQWLIIDKKGTVIESLGKYNETQELNNQAWRRSASDGLFRKKNLANSTVIDQIGLDVVPHSFQINNSTWYSSRINGKSGVFDEKGNVLLPFEYENLYFLYDHYSLEKTTTNYSRFVSATKDGYQYLYDILSMQVLWHSTGALTKDNSFRLMGSLVGDSLFIIEYPDRKLDVLNVKKPYFWNLRVNGRIQAIKNVQTNQNEIVAETLGERSYTKSYNLSGLKIINIPTIDYSTEGYGIWHSRYDPASGKTTIFDTAMQILCIITIPFNKEGNTLDMIKNEGSRSMPFVIMAMSNVGESAVFSLKGKRLSPKYIWKTWVSQDRIITNKNNRMGVFDLLTGKTIVPLRYKFITLQNKTIIALDDANKEHHFNLRGDKLYTIPTGYRRIGQPNDGFQLIYKDPGEYQFLHAKTGFLQLPFEIKNAQPFSNGLAGVQLKENGLWMFINTKGKIAFPGVFFMIQPFKNGYAIVNKGYDKTLVIDTSGKVILSANQAYDSDTHTESIYRYYNKFFAVKGDTGTSLYTLDGKLILAVCMLMNQFDTKENIYFTSNGKFGWILPNLQIKWADKTDFKLIKDKYRGTRSVLEGFGVPIEGLLDTVSGEWIVEPKLRREIFPSPAYAPIVWIADNSWEKSELLDINTRKTITIEPGRLEKTDNGWLLLNDELQKAFLYNQDFTEKKPWNYYHQSIRWNPELHVYSVSDGNGNFIGYMTKNMQLLVEDE